MIYTKSTEWYSLVTFVATFCAERCFVGPYVVAVPVHEIRGGVNGRCHVHMHHDEIIIPRLCSRVFASRKFGRSLRDAINGRGVCFPFFLRQVATIRCQLHGLNISRNYLQLLAYSNSVFVTCCRPRQTV